VGAAWSGAKPSAWQHGSTCGVSLCLPGTTEGTSRGSRTWLVDGKMFVWERPLRRTDLAALGERAPAGRSSAPEPATLRSKRRCWRPKRPLSPQPHFDGYAAILIDLAAIDVARLEPIVVEAWLIPPLRVVIAAKTASRLSTLASVGVAITLAHKISDGPDGVTLSLIASRSSTTLGRCELHDGLTPARARPPVRGAVPPSMRVQGAFSDGRAIQTPGLTVRTR
jgi:hypothetical protein